MSAPGTATDRHRRAREAVEGNRVWYHTLELAPGVTTPGQIDLRGVASKVLPKDLGGRRVVDVGTFDGFWAFEMERRGASEVVATDLERVDAAEWPPLRRDWLRERAREWEIELGRGFRLAAGALGSRARRVECDVYDLSPEAIGGAADLIFAGDILLHLRDPVRALERIHETLAPGGILVSFEPFSPLATLLSPRRPVASFHAHDSDFDWWHASIPALRAWMLTAGFASVEGRGVHRPPATGAMRLWHWASWAKRRG